MLVHKYFDWFDGPRRDPDVNDALHIEDDEDGLFNGPNWAINELRPSVSDNSRLSVRSAFHDVKLACATGGIDVSMDVRGVLSLMPLGVQAVVDLRSSEAAHASALSEKGDALRHGEAADAEKDDALRLIETFEGFSSTKHTELQTLRCAAGEL